MTLDESIIELALKTAYLEGRTDEFSLMVKEFCDEMDDIKKRWDALDYTPGEYTVDGKKCNFPLETQHEPTA